MQKKVKRFTKLQGALFFLWHNWKIGGSTLPLGIFSDSQCVQGSPKCLQKTETFSAGFEALESLSLKELGSFSSNTLQ